MAEKKIKEEKLDKVSGGYVKTTEFAFTLTYLDTDGKTQTGIIYASGNNRTYAKPLAKEKAEDWCNDNNYTFVSIE